MIIPASAESIALFALDGTKLAEGKLNVAAKSTLVVNAGGMAVRYEMNDSNGYWVAGGTVGVGSEYDMNLETPNLEPTQIVTLTMESQ